MIARACTCGARKVYRAADGAREHSDWCDVSLTNLKNPNWHVVNTKTSLVQVAQTPVPGAAIAPFQYPLRPLSVNDFCKCSLQACWESNNAGVITKWCADCLMKATGGWLGQTAANIVGSLKFLYTPGYPSDEPSQHIGKLCTGMPISGPCRNVADFALRGTLRCAGCLGPANSWFWLDMNSPHPGYAKTTAPVNNPTNVNRIVGQGPIMNCSYVVSGGCRTKTGVNFKGQLHYAAFISGLWYATCSTCEAECRKQGYQVQSIATLTPGTKLG